MISVIQYLERLGRQNVKLLIEQGSQPEFVYVKGLTSRLFMGTIS